MEGFADMLGTKYPSISPHSLVIVEQKQDSSTQPSAITCTAFDFLPCNPTALTTAMSLVTGKNCYLSILNNI